MDGERKTAFQKAEELFFPAAAALIGIGYIVAIFMNNPLDKVLSSPHALILIALFAGIAFFPVRSLFRHLPGSGQGGDVK